MPPLPKDMSCIKINSLRSVRSLPQHRSQHALQLEPSPEGANVPGKHCPCLPVCVGILGLGQWGLAPLLSRSPTPPLVTFCPNTCFPAESDFIRETESSARQAAHSHRNGEASLAGRPPKLVHCLPSRPSEGLARQEEGERSAQRG